MNIEQYISKLHDIGALKFGSFTLKSGAVSPFYIDLREMISYPEMLKATADLLAGKISNIPFDYISGVPYTALPVATLLADKLNKSLIYIRKEEKSYGTKQSIIGKYEKGKKCLLIDDLITSGESIMETAEKFKNAGLHVEDVAVIIDRSAHGTKLLSQHGFRLHALFDIHLMTDVLERSGRIDEKRKQDILDFAERLDNRRPKVYSNALTRRLLKIIEQKQSRLVLSLDVDNQRDFFNILEQTAPHIVMLKTHVDILSDFDSSFIEKLKYYAHAFDFMIFEDRKFADIGNTVKKQYRGGIYKISQWSDFVTVHGIPGDGILKGLFDGLEQKASFLLAKMSSEGNLMNDNYTRKILEMGRKYPEVVSGYIGHGHTADEIKRLKNKIPEGQLLLMPGVRINPGKDALGQQYTGVGEAVRGGADLIIVGRDITRAKNPEEKARVYKSESVRYDYL